MPRLDVPTLIRELLDKSYDPGFFRDDCAMNLAYSDPDDEWLHDPVGESIADIAES